MKGHSREREQQVQRGRMAHAHGTFQDLQAGWADWQRGGWKTNRDKPVPGRESQSAHSDNGEAMGGGHSEMSFPLALSFPVIPKLRVCCQDLALAITHHS